MPSLLACEMMLRILRGLTIVSYPVHPSMFSMLSAEEDICGLAFCILCC